MTTAATLSATDPTTVAATSAPAPAPLARVLLIEDNQEEMLLVQYTLEEFGQGRYELEWANRLGPGVDRVREGGLDLVLLDLGLPECQGPVSYLAIRDVAPELPVLVLTGDHRSQTEELVMNYGAEDYLVKEEISGLQLLRAIRGAMFRKKTRSTKLRGTVI